MSMLHLTRSVYQENQEKLYTHMRELVLKNIPPVKNTPVQAWRQAGAEQVLMQKVADQFMRQPSPAQTALLMNAGGNVPRMNVLFNTVLRNVVLEKMNLDKMNIQQQSAIEALINADIDNQEEVDYEENVTNDDNNKDALNQEKETAPRPEYSAVLLPEKESTQEKADQALSKIEKKSEEEREEVAKEFFKEVTEEADSLAEEIGESITEEIKKEALDVAVKMLTGA